MLRLCRSSVYAGNWSRRLLLAAGELLEIAFVDHLAVTVECRTEFYGNPSDMEVSVHCTSVLESEGVLYIYITIYLSLDIGVVADDVTLDCSALAYYNLTLDHQFAFEHAVDTDVIRGDDLTLDDCTSRYSAGCIAFRHHV